MLFLRRSLVVAAVALVTAVAAACGGSSAQTEPVAVHASVATNCGPNQECVTVVGDPCSPCPACPNAPKTSMTKAEYTRLTAPPTCESTHPKKEPAKCIPCES